MVDFRIIYYTNNVEFIWHHEDSRMMEKQYILKGFNGLSSSLHCMLTSGGDDGKMKRLPLTIVLISPPSRSETRRKIKQLQFVRVCLSLYVRVRVCVYVSLCVALSSYLRIFLIQAQTIFVFMVNRWTVNNLQASNKKWRSQYCSSVTTSRTVYLQKHTQTDR